MTTALDHRQRFAAGEFSYLLDFVEATGYRAVDCLAQRTRPAARTVSFRYDVHRRDIHCAYGFIRVHRERSIPGNFFLLHDYSRIERQSEDEFARLATELCSSRSAGAPLHVGFHDSPVDRYLMWSQAEGDESRYVAWLTSAAALDFFGRLAREERAREAFDALVLDGLIASVVAARRVLGPIELSAGHGGKLSQVLRSKLPGLGEVGEVVRACFAENWLSPARLAAAGLVGDVECFKKEVPEIAVVTDGGGRLVKMCEGLTRYTAVGRPVSALVHPATWDERAKREGEWSRILPIPNQKTERVVVSVNPQTLLAELRGEPDGAPFDRALFTEGSKLEAPLARELETRVGRQERFLDLFSDPRHPTRTYEATWGRSLLRYGPTVADVLKACLRAGEASPTAVAMASWLDRELRPGPTPSRLTQGELAYFLFSSSQRGHGLTAIVRHFWRSVAPLRYVDHGAGIGLIAVLLSASIPLASVRCSEIKPQFIAAGEDLWSALGHGPSISFDRCSVTDFPYPGPVDLVFFGHMLYRVPPDQRRSTLLAAISSLGPGGMLVVNELMNRPELDATYAHPCLTSDELMEIIEAGGQLTVHSVDASGPELDMMPARERPREFFRRSDNFVVAVHPKPREPAAEESGD